MHLGYCPENRQADSQSAALLSDAVRVPGEQIEDSIEHRLVDPNAGVSNRDDKVLTLHWHAQKDGSVGPLHLAALLRTRRLQLPPSFQGRSPAGATA
jgi:hypothetical protein